MELIEARYVSSEHVKQFSKDNNMNIHSFLETGYVVKDSGQIIGCFDLVPIEENGAFWLKQLYIIRTEAIKLPLLLEYILHIAREKEAKVVYAHSEQPVTDLLLESVRFSLEESATLQKEIKERRKGHWWSYEYAN